MEKNNNILVTTLGASWQIVPEIVGWTNPEKYDFFNNNVEVLTLRSKYNIRPVKQFWIVTTENQKDFDKLKQWSEYWDVDVKIFICERIRDFTSEDKIRKFRSFLFRVVLNASDAVASHNGKLYLSLTGGRKNMSADMVEAGILFGCDAMFHIIDLNLSPGQRDDDLLGIPGSYAKSFLPVLVNENLPSSFIVSAGDKRITATDFPLSITESNIYREDGELEKEINQRKQQSSQIYSNFYKRIRSQLGDRDIFHQLYFLHPDVLQKLKHIIIGQKPDNFNQDMAILKSLPKADLHTHLGGVLSADDIIEVAKVHPHPEKVKTILEYSGKPADFDRLIFGDYINHDKYYRIGINKYQKLGDYQGSALLQTKETIRKTLEIYARKLIDDNVKYVEIRCSPHKYTKEGLSIDEVVNTITGTMDEQKGIEYQLICIIGRQSGHDEIEKSIHELLSLMKRNNLFKNKLAGIDLAGDESACSPKELREMFMPFLQECVHITIHAGETQPVDNIWEAVYHLNAERIGHGLKLLDKEELSLRFIDKNIGIEMCPSSNRQIVGYGKENDEAYPLKKYMERGLKVTINTDNQGISRTNMSGEFYEAARLCGGLSLWDCFVLIRNSLIISFVEKTMKLKLLREYEKEIFDWCNQSNQLRIL